MAETANVDIPLDEITKGITIELNIKGYRGWIARLKIAEFLIRLGCFIAGMNSKITNDDQSFDSEGDVRARTL
jgi:hypothetical protein